MSKLDDFLHGKPLNPQIARLMKGEDEEETEQPESHVERRNFADGTPITDNDRRHLERMLSSAGWQVLLKLLDTELTHREDAARVSSLQSPLSRKDEVAEMWAELAADKQARQKIVNLAESELAKLKAKKNAVLGRQRRERS